MNILLPSMHKTFDHSIKIICDKMGWHLYFLDDTWEDYLRYGPKYTISQLEAIHGNSINLHTISYEEFLGTDIDIAIMPCSEHHDDFLYNVIRYKGNKCKYIAYLGNDFIFNRYNFDVYRNFLTTDNQGYLMAKQHNIHTELFFPPVDTSIFKYSNNINNTYIGSYIHSYSNTWKQSFNIFGKIINEFGEYVFKNFGKDNLDGNLGNFEDTYKMMSGSIATSHIKEKDGYGYSVIESMFCGRPVIAYRPYVMQRIMKNWLSEDSGLLFDTLEELRTKLNNYMKNSQSIMELQLNAYNSVRKNIDVDEQSEKFVTFIEKLI